MIQNTFKFEKIIVKIYFKWYFISITCHRINLIVCTMETRTVPKPGQLMFNLYSQMSYLLFCNIFYVFFDTHIFHHHCRVLWQSPPCLNYPGNIRPEISKLCSMTFDRIVKQTSKVLHHVPQKNKKSQGLDIEGKLYLECNSLLYNCL